MSTPIDPKGPFNTLDGARIIMGHISEQIMPSVKGLRKLSVEVSAYKQGFRNSFSKSSISRNDPVKIGKIAAKVERHLIRAGRDPQVETKPPLPPETEVLLPVSVPRVRQRGMNLLRFCAQGHSAQFLKIRLRSEQQTKA